MFDFEVTGLDELIKFTDHYASTLEKRVGTYLERAAAMVVDKARSNLQNNTNISTGDLLASIRILSNKNGLEIVVGTDMPYSVYIEYGRGPVYPKKEGGVLHWKDKTTGKDVFAKFAREYEPHPFMEPAVIEVMANFKSILIQNETEYVQELM